MLCFQGALKGTRSGLEEGRVCRVLAEGGGWVIHHCRVVGQAARELGCICVWRLSLENRGAGGNRPWRGGGRPWRQRAVEQVGKAAVKAMTAASLQAQWAATLA